MISYRFVPISSQKGVLFFETPGTYSIILHYTTQQGRYHGERKTMSTPWPIRRNTRNVNLQTATQLTIKDYRIPH